MTKRLAEIEHPCPIPRRSPDGVIFNIIYNYDPDFMRATPREPRKTTSKELNNGTEEAGTERQHRP